MDRVILKKVFTTFIRSKLEYAAVVWRPYFKKNINTLETVQRHATQWVMELENNSYEEKLEPLTMLKQEDRRKRRDIITT